MCVFFFFFFFVHLVCHTPVLAFFVLICSTTTLAQKPIEYRNLNYSIILFIIIIVVYTRFILSLCDFVMDKSTCAPVLQLKINEQQNSSSQKSKCYFIHQGKWWWWWGWWFAKRIEWMEYFWKDFNASPLMRQSKTIRKTYPMHSFN